MKTKGFNNEADFRKYLCNKLDKYGFTQKIECRDLNAGVPDMVFCYKNYDLFIELKNEKKDLCLAEECLNDKNRTIKVNWRKGRQRWSMLYRKAHCSYFSIITIIAYKNCFVYIPMLDYFHDNIVPIIKCAVYTNINDLISYALIED